MGLYILEVSGLASWRKTLKAMLAPLCCGIVTALAAWTASILLQSSNALISVLVPILVGAACFGIAAAMLVGDVRQLAAKALKTRNGAAA